MCFISCKESDMAKHIVLVNWTEQGVKTVKDTIKRSRDFRQLAKSVGVEVTDISWVLGPYDIVCTLNAPDDETATRLGLMLAMQGNVRTTTMRAFSESEMEGIIKGLP